MNIFVTTKHIWLNYVNAYKKDRSFICHLCSDEDTTHSWFRSIINLSEIILDANLFSSAASRIKLDQKKSDLVITTKSPRKQSKF